MFTWTTLWTDIFTKLYFPGNLVWKIWRGKSTPDAKFLPRDGVQPPSSLGGIEYVEINIKDSRSVLLVSHGRLRTLDQGSVDQWREWGQKEGFSILLHNYPGYGGTSGPATAPRIVADLEILVGMLKGKKWEEEQISLLGNSAGCGPTISLAAKEKYRFKKVVLISPYTSCFSWGGSEFLSFLKGTRFDPFVSINLMPKLKDREVLMVCGKGDRTIPASNSAELFESLGMHSKNHKKNYLCTLPTEGHKYTRLTAMTAIALFLNDESDRLAGELQKLTEGNTEVSHNKYSD